MTISFWEERMLVATDLRFNSWTDQVGGKKRCLACSTRGRRLLFWKAALSSCPRCNIYYLIQVDLISSMQGNTFYQTAEQQRCSFGSAVVFSWNHNMKHHCPRVLVSWRLKINQCKKDLLLAIYYHIPLLPHWLYCLSFSSLLIQQSCRELSCRREMSSWGSY